MKCFLGISNFLEEICSLSHSNFSSISLHWSLRKVFLSLLAILWNSAFKWYIFPFLLCLFTSQMLRSPSKRKWYSEIEGARGVQASWQICSNSAFGPSARAALGAHVLRVLMGHMCGCLVGVSMQPLLSGKASEGWEESVAAVVPTGRIWNWQGSSLTRAAAWRLICRGREKAQSGWSFGS